MTRWKKQLRGKIRNVKLIPELDEGFVDYMSEIKLQRFHLRSRKQRRYVDLISGPLEETIRKWVELSGAGLKERILSYEILNLNDKYKKRYNELDVAFRINNTLFLAEVKVSSSEKSVLKASNQLLNARDILRTAGIDVELMVIHIDFNHRNTAVECHLFKDNFLDLIFNKIVVDADTFFYLHLIPDDIFKWGVNKRVILNAELLTKAIEEFDQLHQWRVKRLELKGLGVLKEDWPDEYRNINQDNILTTYIASFGETSSPTLLSEKLKSALGRAAD